MDVQRENGARMALGIFLQCWRRGFVVYQDAGRVYVSGPDDRDFSLRTARLLVAKFEDILLPRVPRRPK